MIYSLTLENNGFHGSYMTTCPEILHKIYLFYASKFFSFIKFVRCLSLLFVSWFVIHKLINQLKDQTLIQVETINNG